MRRACAFGRNPSCRIASRTRARVALLTRGLEFKTREMVATPTPAVRATSRMVVCLGTVFIARSLYPTTVLPPWAVGADDLRLALIYHNTRAQYVRSLRPETSA